MALSTYTELLASVKDWLRRSSYDDQAADFITLAETELNADVHMRQMESDEPVTLTISTNTIALPSRFIEPISFEITISGQENIPLTYQPPHRLLFNTASGARCRPQIFTVNGDNIEFPNLSDATYSCVFRMVKGFDIEATSTNALLTAYPGLYLYGALLQAAPYLKDDNRIVTWQTLYDRLLAKVKRKESRKNALTSLVSDHPSAGNGWRNNIITG